jgi:hypothetical protein
MGFVWNSILEIFNHGALVRCGSRIYLGCVSIENLDSYQEENISKNALQ